MFSRIKYTIIAIVLILVFISGKNALQNINTETVDIRVERLVAQPIIGKDNTTYRYIVITDKETFIVESSIIHLKFNNSDLFYHFKEGGKYKIEVCGTGKTLFTDYRNILDVVK
jgi:hypothetical protein